MTAPQTPVPGVVDSLAPGAVPICDCLELIARMCRDLHAIAVHHHLEHDLSRVADELLAVQCLHRIERAVQADGRAVS